MAVTLGSDLLEENKLLKHLNSVLERKLAGTEAKIKPMEEEIEQYTYKNLKSLKLNWLLKNNVTMKSGISMRIMTAIKYYF